AIDDAVFHGETFGGAPHDLACELGFVLDVLLALAALDLVERRLRDVNVLPVNQLAHVPEEERQQQRADVRAVDIRVGHDDDLVVTELFGLEIVFADTSAHRRNQRADFFVAQHAVITGLFDIENLALERQDSLETAVAALLGRAAG